MAKVTKMAIVGNSDCSNIPKWARVAKVNMAIEMVSPTGTEYSRIFLAKRFLIRSVLCSSAKMRPGKPIQAKLRSDISTGDSKGALNGIKINRTARILA